MANVVRWFFVDFCTEDPVRYQLLFQRTIPGFEPSPESYAISVQGLEATQARLADQQISNDPGGDRWSRLVDEAMEMFLDHVSQKQKRRKVRR